MGDSWVFSAAVIGILVGVVLSAIQWLALRRVARRAAIWVPAHAAAWTVGAIVAFAGIRGIPDGLIPALVVGSAALVGMAMGAAIAAITGLALLWVLRGEQGGKASAT